MSGDCALSVGFDVLRLAFEAESGRAGVVAGAGAGADASRDAGLGTGAGGGGRGAATGVGAGSDGPVSDKRFDMDIGLLARGGYRNCQS